MENGAVEPSGIELNVIRISTARIIRSSSKLIIRNSTKRIICSSTQRIIRISTKHIIRAGAQFCSAFDPVEHGTVEPSGIGPEGRYRFTELRIIRLDLDFY